jgi:hypothetical protein
MGVNWHVCNACMTEQVVCAGRHCMKVVRSGCNVMHVLELCYQLFCSSTFLVSCSHYDHFIQELKETAPLVNFDLIN